MATTVEPVHQKSSTVCNRSLVAIPVHHKVAITWSFSKVKVKGRQFV